MASSSSNTPQVVRQKAWDKKLRSEFEDVPSNTTDESMWYGPWDTTIHRMFKDADGFQIAPQHLKPGHRGEPEWTVYYLIRRGSIPVCIVEIKQYLHLKRPQKRIDAWTQVEDRLKELLDDEPIIPTIYGVSVIGDRFLIMQLDTATGHISPPLNTQCHISQVAPANWWRNQVLKRAGFKRLATMVAQIKEMCADFPPREPHDEEPASDDDVSDTSTISFRDAED